jgi:large subunit ribosomal protein L33
MEAEKWARRLRSIKVSAADFLDCLCPNSVILGYNPEFQIITGHALLEGLRAMGKGGKKKAEVVFLVCEETGDYNYSLRRKPGGEKLKLKKYSPRLRKHTLHAEKKK